MQIKMAKATRSVYGNLRVGQTLDVDSNTGARWIKHGLAVAAEQAPLEPKEPAPAKSKK